MTEIKRIYNVGESLVNLMGWQVERFDIQAYHMSGGFDGFCGYLTTKDNGSFRIRTDGTFERIKK